MGKCTSLVGRNVLRLCRLPGRSDGGGGDVGADYRTSDHKNTALWLPRYLFQVRLDSKPVLLLLEVLWMSARRRFEAPSGSEGSDPLWSLRSCCTRHFRRRFAAIGEVSSSDDWCGVKLAVLHRVGFSGYYGAGRCESFSSEDPKGRDTSLAL